jgi:2-C-methyl-D-erythritol 4-phosphate cytidylyltransferase/2-C-methyl-D-erythritol 2,4-cyclodiphosphate synthase
VNVAAVVVAGGRGTRFGGLKQFVSFAGSTVAAHAVSSARIVADVVVLVVPADYEGSGEGADLVVSGGDSRSASVRAGLDVVPLADVVVVHDAARPLASAELFLRVVNAIHAGADAAIPALPVTDTVKRVVGDVVVATVPRADLVTVQTPQAFRRSVLLAAHAAGGDATDDAALVEASGGRVVIVSGEPDNMKITDPGDEVRLRRRRGVGMKIGQGLDVHAFSDDPTRPLMLGLITVEGPGLVGHSDADVATHALCDALLGAANLGDLGRHFPDTDPTWSGVSSEVLLREVVEKIARLGYRPASADVTIVAERPKLAASMPAMSRALSTVVGCVVSVKATTAEGLGALGRAEGIAATAVVLLEEFS